MGSKCEEFHILFSAGKTSTCPFSLSIGCCEVEDDDDGEDDGDHNGLCLWSGRQTSCFLGHALSMWTILLNIWVSLHKILRMRLSFLQYRLSP